MANPCVPIFPVDQTVETCCCSCREAPNGQLRRKYMWEKLMGITALFKVSSVISSGEYEAGIVLPETPKHKNPISEI